MTQTAAAHVITTDAVALGDPEIIIMTRDEGMGAEVIETHELLTECEGHESLRGDSMGATIYCDGRCLPSPLRQLRKLDDWRVVGERTEVQPGYWIVDVEQV